MTDGNRSVQEDQPADQSQGCDDAEGERNRILSHGSLLPMLLTLGQDGRVGGVLQHVGARRYRLQFRHRLPVKASCCV
jgi:hypothetical protein